MEAYDGGAPGPGAGGWFTSGPLMALKALQEAAHRDRVALAEARAGARARWLIACAIWLILTPALLGLAQSDDPLRSAVGWWRCSRSSCRMELPRDRPFSGQGAAHP